jgi:hypothetical protein
VLDLTGSGGDHNIEIFADYYGSATVPNPAIIGTPDANSRIVLHHVNLSGISTADSTFIFPGTIKTGGFAAGKDYGSGVGINTGVNSGIAAAIETGGDAKRGLVIFAHSGTQSADLFALQNSAFADMFKVSGSGGTTIAGRYNAPLSTPASATAAGTTGDVAWDANFVYVCVATNSWKRVAIAAW